MRKMILLSLLVSLSMLLAACGGTATPVADTTSVHIAVETNPNPMMMENEAELILIITDANGNPIEGATVDVSAEHTGHNMGGPMSGVATEQGNGRYAINTVFSMSGTWKLTVYVSKDGLDYKEEFDIPVQ